MVKQPDFFETRNLVALSCYTVVDEDFFFIAVNTEEFMAIMMGDT